MRGGGDLGEYTFLRPTFLPPQRRWLHGLKTSLLDVSFELQSLQTHIGALASDSPGCHNHSRITSWPRSYILHGTILFPHNTSETISTNIHHWWNGKNKKTHKNTHKLWPSTRTHICNNTHTWEAYIYHQHTNTPITHSTFTTKRQHTQNTKQDQKNIILQISKTPTSTSNAQIDHFQTTFHIQNTLPTYKYIYFKTSFIIMACVWGPMRKFLRVRASVLLHFHLCAFLISLAR